MNKISKNIKRFLQVTIAWLIVVAMLAEAPATLLAAPPGQAGFEMGVAHRASHALNNGYETRRARNMAPTMTNAQVTNALLEPTQVPHPEARIGTRSQNSNYQNGTLIIWQLGAGARILPNDATTFTPALVAGTTIQFEYAYITPITFNTNGGPAMNNHFAQVGGQLRNVWTNAEPAAPNTGRLTQLPSPPARTGWTFMGWFDTLANADGSTDTGRVSPTSDARVTGPRTLFARWERNPLTVSHNLRGGTMSPWTPGTVAYGGTFTIPVDRRPATGAARPTRGLVEGRTVEFVGWATTNLNVGGGTSTTPLAYGAATPAGILGNTVTNVTNDITLNAIWRFTQPVRFNVNFRHNVTNSAGNITGAPRSVVQAANLNTASTTPATGFPTTPAAPASGGTFAGWFTSANLNANPTGAAFAATTAINAETSLYAGWNSTINFVRNHPGGTPDNAAVGSPITVVRGWSQGTGNNRPPFTLPAAPTAPAGYRFVGWYTQRTGGSRIGANDTTAAQTNQRLPQGAGNQT